MRSNDGLIVCDNSLDARVELIFEQLLPEIRQSLFAKSHWNSQKIFIKLIIMQKCCIVNKLKSLLKNQYFLFRCWTRRSVLALFAEESIKKIIPIFYLFVNVFIDGREFLRYVILFWFFDVSINFWRLYYDYFFILLIFISN